MKDFGISLAQFSTILATTLQTTEAARMPRIEKPKTIENKQINAETARTSRELQITNIICFVSADFECNIRLA